MSERQICPYTNKAWRSFLFGPFFSIDIPMLPAPEDQDHNDAISNDFELDRDQITLVRILGTGNFGVVSKATYGDSSLEVAVKSPKGIAFIFFIMFITIYKRFTII